ncbi:NAD-dependent epimerase/dehydratase family protein [Sphingomonas faeni]|uniref:NAD-dependent epimerase/dehydratase family protein n=1 Tax=Sphingomonas faeni TaxID=185950 RepID=UPI00335C1DE6
MMRVLVLGADGFVGRRVIDALDASDWAIPVAGVRRVKSGGSVERVLLDATDRSSLASALDGIDAVVNAVVGAAPTILANAGAVAATAGSRRIVHLSSMAVYGSAVGRIAEDAPLLADTGAYAAAKAKAEQCLAACQNLALLRPGCIYGPGSGQWTTRIADLLNARRIGDLGAGGDGCSNLVHIDDVVAAILAAVRMADRGAFNLAMPGAPDWNSYFFAFARALGAVPVARVPGWRLKLETKLLAVPFKLAEKTGRLPPAIPPSLVRLWAQDIRLDPTRADAVFQIDWTPLDHGVAGAAAWLSRPRTIA